VHEDLDLLLKLQVIDYDLGELERSKDYLPDMMENLNREIEEARTRHSEIKQKLEDAKVLQGSLELEIATSEAELQKYQQQMMSIKTNKEYDALVAQIDSLKEGISRRETTLLETIETLGNLEKEVVGLAEKEAQIVENNQKQLEILQKKVDSIGEKVASKHGTRDSVMAEIPRSTLSTYERVRRGRGGRAVVPVKKKACSGCFKALTPKKIQEIRRNEKVHTCDNCGCLLFWDDDISKD